MTIAEEHRVTIDHDTIRRWAEERDGYAATVTGSHSGEEPGVLRIGFEGDEGLERIGWDAFFEKFEEKALAMRYHNEPPESGSDRFHEFFKRR
ncbi:MAG: hypothetical protein WD314_14950 [Trueperaceae bacterium]